MYAADSLQSLSFLKVTFESEHSRMDQVKFVEDSLYKILLGPFLNIVSHFQLFLSKVFSQYRPNYQINHKEVIEIRTEFCFLDN